MERCPNCGNPVRVGARFCTSCGHRLAPTGGDPQAGVPAPAVSAAGAEPTGQAEAGSGWPDRVVWAEPAAADDRERSSGTPADGDGTGDEPRAADGWRTPTAAAAPAPDTGASPVEPESEDPFAEWEEDLTEATQAAPAEGPPTDDTPPPAPDAPGEGTVVLDDAFFPEEAPDTTAVADEAAPADANRDDSEDAPVAADLERVLWTTPAAGPESDPDTDPATAEPAVAEETVGEGTDASPDDAIVLLGDRADAAVGTTDDATAGPPAGDPLARASALADDLRAAIAAARSGGTSGAAERVAADLAAARSAAAPADEADFADLREALASARGRPRDIDTMLDIVGRLDAIVALQEAHDRYAAGIDAAVALLRGGDGQGGQGG